MFQEDSNIIAASAAAIACISLIVSIWHGHLQRRHNILSVKPQLNLYSIFNSNEDVTLYISNDGLGTAIIKSFKIEEDGIVKDVDSVTTFMSALVDKSMHRDKLNITFNFFNKNSAIRAGSSQNIICYEGSRKDIEIASDIVLSLSDTYFIIEYECMYGKKYKLREKHFLSV